MSASRSGADVEVVLRDGATATWLVLSAWVVPDEVVASLPLVLAAVLEASEAAGGTEPRRHLEDGRPLAWRGAEAAAAGLLHAVEHERTSHACCADSPTLLLAWPGPDAPAQAEVAERMRERLTSLETAALREREHFKAEEAEPVLGRALRMLGLGWLDGLAPVHDPVDVHELLHGLSNARLSLEASLHFQQGHHALEAAWMAEAPVLAALRADLAARLRVMSPRVALRG